MILLAIILISKIIHLFVARILAMIVSKYLYKSGKNKWMNYGKYES